MNKLLLSFLFLLPVALLAQAPINTDNLNLNTTDFFLRIFEAKEQDVDHAEDPRIKGTRYYNDQFIEGEVFTTEQKMANLPLRYDIFYDTFQFKLSGQLRSMPASSIVKMVKLNRDVFVPKSYPFRGNMKQGYLQQLVQGKYSLFAKKNITLRPEQPPRALETESKPAEYLKMKDTYFVENENGQFVEISSGKDLAKKLGNSKFIAEAKDQKISLKGDKNLIPLVQLMNEMGL